MPRRKKSDIINEIQKELKEMEEQGSTNVSNPVRGDTPLIERSPNNPTSPVPSTSAAALGTPTTLNHDRVLPFHTEPFHEPNVRAVTPVALGLDVAHYTDELMTDISEFQKTNENYRKAIEAKDNSGSTMDEISLSFQPNNNISGSNVRRGFLSGDEVFEFFASQEASSTTSTMNNRTTNEAVGVIPVLPDANLGQMGSNGGSITGRKNAVQDTPPELLQGQRKKNDSRGTEANPENGEFARFAEIVSSLRNILSVFLDARDLVDRGGRRLRNRETKILTDMCRAYAQELLSILRKTNGEENNPSATITIKQEREPEVIEIDSDQEVI